jgi:hypothetical protein
MVTGPHSATVPSSVVHITKRGGTIMTSATWWTGTTIHPYLMVVSSLRIVTVARVGTNLPPLPTPLVVIISCGYISGRTIPSPSAMQITPGCVECVLASGEGVMLPATGAMDLSARLQVQLVLEAYTYPLLYTVCASASEFESKIEAHTAKPNATNKLAMLIFVFPISPPSYKRSSPDDASLFNTFPTAFRSHRFDYSVQCTCTSCYPSCGGIFIGSCPRDKRGCKDGGGLLSPASRGFFSRNPGWCECFCGVLQRYARWSSPHT